MPNDAQALSVARLALPGLPNGIFVHDVALRPVAQGRDVARAFLAIVRETARDLGFRHLQRGCTTPPAACMQRQHLPAV